MKRGFPVVCIALLLAGCNYLETATRQAWMAARQPVSPRQRVYKHMLERDTFFVFGEIRVPHRDRQEALAVVALSDAFRPGEVVDVNHTSRHDSYYGLNLPAGVFRLCAVSDQNRDGVFDQDEVIAVREVDLNLEAVPDKVFGDCDLKDPLEAPLATRFRIEVPAEIARVESAIFPKGTLRSLDDSIFSPEMASLGLYEPAAFLERAPMMFYAMEEDLGYKVPVIFVHGIGGSARDFEAIVDQLDRRYYRPWFFHYPSGTDLDQLSAMFYRIFLSGRVIPLDETPVVIVAHSMGGLIVRDALSRCKGSGRESHVRALVTIASPLGGHPGASKSQRAPVVIPSWRDLAPESAFIREVNRRPLPAGLVYDLVFTFGDERLVKIGQSSDGVVPLSSQCVEWAQAEAQEQRGFDDTHVGVLHNPEAIRYVIEKIEAVHPFFPDDHLAVLLEGGYPVDRDDFTPIEVYLIENYGRWMDALVAGELQAFHPTQEHFVRACRGEVSPNQPIERAWLKYHHQD